MERREIALQVPFDFGKAVANMPTSPCKVGFQDSADSLGRPHLLGGLDSGGVIAEFHLGVEFGRRLARLRRMQRRKFPEGDSPVLRANLYWKTHVFEPLALSRNPRPLRSESKVIVSSLPGGVAAWRSRCQSISSGSP